MSLFSGCVMRATVFGGMMIVMAFWMGGCAAQSGHDSHAMHAGTTAPHHAAMWEHVTEAVAVVYPTEGKSATGVVRFVQMGDRVHVTADIQGLTPNGTHGFHIHEFGDATGAGGMNAGGHYNPEGSPHAGMTTPHRHAGDLGNLKADASGRATLDVIVDNISVAGMHNPIIGRSVVIHQNADDLTSQPAGNAGPRIGVGVIGIAHVVK